MPKTKWYGAEEHTIMLLSVRTERRQPQYFISTEVDRNTPWRQVSLGTHMVHQQRHMPSGKINQNRYTTSGVTFKL